MRSGTGFENWISASVSTNALFLCPDLELYLFSIFLCFAWKNTLEKYWSEPRKTNTSCSPLSVDSETIGPIEAE